MSKYTALPASGHTARWGAWEGDDIEVTDFAWENEAGRSAVRSPASVCNTSVRLSATWQVRQFLLFRDLEEPDLWLATDGTARWGEMNGAHRSELDGCYDLDLACTPFTNSLPIRRLPLLVGDSTELPVVTIDVETLEVRPVTHRYMRLGTHRWAFAHDDHSVEFEVDEHGLVIDYPGMFRRLS